MSQEKAQGTITNENNYDSNPFTLAFNSFSRFFSTNVGWALAILALALVSFIGQLFSNLLQVASRESLNSTSTAASTTPIASTTVSQSPNVGLVLLIIVIALILITVIVIISTAISVFISGMFSYVAIQSEAGKSVGFSEAWEQTAKRFWRLFKAQLLAGLKIFGWTLLFIIPGIVAGFRYALLPFVIMGDSAKEKGARSSHALTKKLVKGRLMEVFGIATVAGIVPFVGQLLRLTGNAALYGQLSAYDKANLEKPKVHWLNYLGFILIGFVLLLIILIVTIIAVAYTQS